MNRSQRWAVVAVALVAALGVTASLRDPEPEFAGVRDLANAIEQEGPACGGPLTVEDKRVADRVRYETASCDSFDGNDVANFYWFADPATMEAFFDSQTLVDFRDFDGVLGPNWFVSVADRSTTLEIQEAVGGEINGYEG